MDQEKMMLHAVGILERAGHTARADEHYQVRAVVAVCVPKFWQTLPTRPLATDSAT
jgi:hypothetical protein